MWEYEDNEMQVVASLRPCLPASCLPWKLTAVEAAICLLETPV
ncbi:hypothetical protein [Paenibacillus mesotrionivorans]|uniref:Uncharacterized protein n=1 Tax=Paenibacillus mesotrionivorans TaxID=3160968 RepID=A0ACC7P244_9BACL